MGRNERRNLTLQNESAKEKKGIKKSLAETLKLPQDAVCGDTLVHVLGTSRVKVENYRNILVYSDTMIKLQAKPYQVVVEGKRLRIRYYDKDEMEIGGKIERVGFQ